MSKHIPLTELPTLLLASRALKDSPIYYVIVLLDDYFQGRITGAELREQYHIQTKKAQIVFSHMSPKDIDEIRRVCVQEFSFGDALTDAIEHNEHADNESLQTALRGCIEDYLRAAHVKVKKGR